MDMKLKPEYMKYLVAWSYTLNIFAIYLCSIRMMMGIFNTVIDYKHLLLYNGMVVVGMDTIIIIMTIYYDIRKNASFLHTKKFNLIVKVNDYFSKMLYLSIGIGLAFIGYQYFNGINYKYKEFVEYCVIIYGILIIPFLLKIIKNYLVIKFGKVVENNN